MDEEWDTARYFCNKTKTMIVFDEYEASTFGRIRNVGTGRMMKFHQEHDHAHVSLYLEKKRKTMAVLRIVGSTFLGEPADPKMSVGRINHDDGQNNSVNNLRWVTTPERLKSRRPFRNRGSMTPVVQINVQTGERTYFNSTSDVWGIKKSARVCEFLKNGKIKDGYRYEVVSISTIDGEKWEQWQGYEISDAGRIRKHHALTDRFYEVILTPNAEGYRFLIGDTGKRYVLSRIVGHLFHGLSIDDQSIVVNHKSEQPTDNRVDNLELITQAENVRYSCLKLYSVCNSETGEKWTLEGMDEVKKHTSLPHGKIYQILKSGKRHLNWTIQVSERFAERCKRVKSDQESKE